jgi:hypothetical protein
MKKLFRLKATAYTPGGASRTAKIIIILVLLGVALLFLV